MEDTELLRYSRQIMLADVDVAGQQKLLDATVLIVGLGGLGSPAALYLASAGVGKLILCDHDAVDLSNLQRQIAHTTHAIGENKAASAKQRITEINPTITLTTVDARIDGANLDVLLQDVTLVLDCTDNFDTRQLINDRCWERHIPVVSGAAIRWEGQITIFDPTQTDAPCYRCLYPTADEAALNCAENGVIAPLVGIIGTAQALEAIKYICGVGETLVGYVLYFDAKYMDWRKLKLNPRSQCETCSA